MTRNIEVDDSWIVPYSAVLLKYECHVNLEIVSTHRLAKGLFKYISKASPWRMTVVREDEEVDEVAEHVTTRYIGASYAAWRVPEFHIAGRMTKVINSWITY